MISVEATKHMLDMALADVRPYYTPEQTVIIMGNNAYVDAQKGGVIVDGKYGDVAVELSGEVHPDMVYVASKE